VTEEQKARDIADGLPYFNFEDFQKRYYNDFTADLEGVFQNYIDTLVRSERFKTAQGYEHALVKLKAYAKSKKIALSDLNFITITPDFLHGFEEWMIGEGRSINTVSIYLRYLRSIFNQAIDSGLITSEVYPFGKSKSKFTIAATKNTKRSLSEEEIKALYLVETKTDFEERAKKFWFLSYSLNGINMKDLAELKKSDYKDGAIEYYRAKTSQSTRDNRQKIVLLVTDFSRELIEELKEEVFESSPYLLPIYRDKMTTLEKEATRRDFIKNVNSNMAKLSKRAGFNFNVTTYYARHSYTTVALNNGASLEMLRETLGHKDLKTTMNYVGSFKESKMKDLSDQVTSFLEK